MAFSFMPKTTEFFDLFNDQAENLVQGSRLFSEIVKGNKFEDVSAEQMHALEHKGDEINHKIVKFLNETLVPPFDREDVIAFAGNMDNVIDGMYMITKRLTIYKIKEATPELVQYAELLERCTVTLHKAVSYLNHSSKNMKEILRHCVEINRLENEGDALRDKAIAHLFEDAKDPLLIIKWKEIYEAAETVTDMCEYVANIIEAILVKNN
jgi:predicted phosphate transport protein (TIGR00153 family)